MVIPDRCAVLVAGYLERQAPWLKYMRLSNKCHPLFGRFLIGHIFQQINLSAIVFTKQADGAEA